MVPGTNWLWWDEAGPWRAADRAGVSRGEAGVFGGRAGELRVGRSSEARRPPHAEQNCPAAGTSAPQLTQRTTKASVIGEKRRVARLMIIEVPKVHGSD
jgi:hypothetical protein